MGVGAAGQAARGQRQARAAAKREHRSECGRRADREMQDLSAIGLQQNVLHAEAGGSERGRDKTSARAPFGGEIGPGVKKARPRRGFARRVWVLRGSCFQSAAQFNSIVTTAAPCTTWMSRTSLKCAQQEAKRDRADRHAGKQHRAKQGDDARARAFRRKVGRQGEANGLNRMKTGADQQKRQRGRGLSDPERAGRISGENEQRERHDREAAELRHRAEPDVGNPPPSEHRTVIVGTKADQGAQGREQQRQRKHAGDDP